jgi:hypothetical protein
MNDVTWIGSSYFQGTSGFYDTYHSSTPRTAWPYDATRDAGLAQVDSGGGYPTCQQWWSDGGSGLRARLLAQVDPDLLSRIGHWAGFLSQNEVNDSVIRAVVSPSQQKMNQGAVYTDYGGQIEKTLPNIVTRGAGDIGMTVGSLGFFPPWMWSARRCPWCCRCSRWHSSSHPAGAALRHLRAESHGRR